MYRAQVAPSTSAPLRSFGSLEYVPQRKYWLCSRSVVGWRCGAGAARPHTSTPPQIKSCRSQLLRRLPRQLVDQRAALLDLWVVGRRPERRVERGARPVELLGIKFTKRTPLWSLFPHCYALNNAAAFCAGLGLGFSRFRLTLADGSPST